MTSNDERMKQALEAWFSIDIHQQRPSIRQHTKDFMVDRSTFTRRINGGLTPLQSHEYQQRLTKVQEDWLVQWIKEMDERGQPPSHARARARARAREMASQICLANGDTKPLGPTWLNQFTQRNPSVRTVIGRVIKAARVDGTRPESNKRKRIEKNPNTTFAGTEQIMAAQEAQAQQEREKALEQAEIDHERLEKLEKHAELAARAIQAKKFKACLFEWQIDNYLVDEMDQKLAQS
jgi:hypothetical protein